MATDSERDALFPALLALVRPVVVFCLRYGFSIHDLVKVAKRAFIEVATEQITASGGTPNSSRISVLSGLHRNDITKLIQAAPPLESDPQSILGRVMVQWENDRRYSKRGKPKTLSCFGEGSEFWRLVHTVSSNLGPATLMLEMIRMGLAVRKGESLSLVRRGENLSGATTKAFEFVGKDFRTLLEAVAENTSQPDHLGNLQIRTYFDNVYRKHIPQIRSWLIEEGKEFHKKARHFLSELDADITPDSTDKEGAGVQVSLSAFSHIRVPGDGE